MAGLRRQIVWLGREELEGFAGAAEERDLLFSPQPASEFDPHAETLRAVLLPVGELRASLIKLVAAADSGALCIVIAKGATGFAAASGIINELDTAQGLGFISVKSGDRLELLRAVNNHDPGPAPKLGLAIDGDVPSDKSAQLLLKRAFADCSEIRVRKLVGGRSSADGIWRVAAKHADGRFCEPFIAKIGPNIDVSEERQKYQSFVRDFVAFPFRPALMKSGFIRGAQKSFLGSTFVGRAQRLDEYVCAVRDPQLAISALFDGPLRNWRAAFEMKRAALGRYYVEEATPSKNIIAQDSATGRISRALLPSVNRLEDAHYLASLVDQDTPTPAQLYKMLSDLPETQYRESVGHGDLNARNAFVRLNGLDVVLIDFTHVNRMPESRDPSRLEVNLAFDVGNDVTGMLPDDTLRELYRPPLLPCRHRTDPNDGRVAAIRQIRCHTAGEGVGNEEYEITTACHLLRYARKVDGFGNTANCLDKSHDGPETIRLRRTSYMLAAALIRQLHDSKRAAVSTATTW